MLFRSKLSVNASRIRVDSDANHSDMTFDLRAIEGPRIEDLMAFLQERFPEAERITFERG